VLLPGAAMPAADSLPAPLQALAQRNATTLGDAHWQADIGRLLAVIGMPPRRRRWPWALAAALPAAALAAAWWLLHPASAPPPAPVAAPDFSQRLLGSWQAEVRYDWGDRHLERFEFKRHAGELTGTASFLKMPRAIENLRVDGANLHFQTRSQVSMGDASREATRSYAAELRGAAPDEVLAFRMQSTGGFSSERPIEFEARRVPPGAAASAAPAPR
jgi:hypothetical protein